MFQETLWEDDKEHAVLAARLFSGPCSKDKGLHGAKKNRPEDKRKFSKGHGERFPSAKGDYSKPTEAKCRGNRESKAALVKDEFEKKRKKRRVMVAEAKSSSTFPPQEPFGLPKEKGDGSLQKSADFDPKKEFVVALKARKCKKGKSTGKREIDADKSQKVPRTYHEGNTTSKMHIKAKVTGRSKQNADGLVVNDATHSKEEEVVVEDFELSRTSMSSKAMPKHLAKFQSRIRKKLEGSQFRWLNEKLYTSHSSAANKMFSEKPDLFDTYHIGFTSQVTSWPTNPVDKIIAYIKSKPSSMVVADFGCGDAQIAQSLPNKVHSFDLVARNDFVTACDMAKVPLDNKTIDICVFCLSLMGTNLVDFISEAHRVLKLRGVLKIAEVASRFDDLEDFIKHISSCGFKFMEKDFTNSFFVLLEFEKSSKSFHQPSHPLTLKPCIYKRR